MQDDIERAAKRARAYWLVDGLPEIVTGLSFLAAGLCIALPYILPAGRGSAGALALPLVVAVFILGGRKFIKSIKERITYPRTGYVAYSQPGVKRRVFILILGMVIAAVGVMGAIQLPQVYLDYLPLFQGFFVALIFLMVALRSGGVVRLYLFSALALLLGFFQMMFWGIEGYGSVFFFCALGAVVFVSGLNTLRIYVKQPLPEEYQNGN